MFLCQAKPFLIQTQPNTVTHSSSTLSGTARSKIPLGKSKTRINVAHLLEAQPPDHILTSVYWQLAREHKKLWISPSNQHYEESFLIEYLIVNPYFIDVNFAQWLLFRP
jgi:hypothetical protein